LFRKLVQVSPPEPVAHQVDAEEVSQKGKHRESEFVPAEGVHIRSVSQPPEPPIELHVSSFRLGPRSRQTARLFSTSIHLRFDPHIDVPGWALHVFRHSLSPPYEIQFRDG
jgi:hypothetical protein